MTGSLYLPNAKIINKHFSGEITKDNPYGKRYFFVILDDEDAKTLESAGWTIHYINEVTPCIKVSINLMGVTPVIKLISENGKKQNTDITELDAIDFKTADLICYPGYWRTPTKSGKVPLLATMDIKVTPEEVLI